MNQYFGYVRVSTDQQDSQRQRLAILEWGQNKDIRIEEIIEATMSSRKTLKDRRIDELQDRVSRNDTVVFSELSRLGRSISEILRLVEEFKKHGVRLIFLKENIELSPDSEQDMQSKVMLTLFSLFAEIERDLISERTREGLAARRRAGVKLGRPLGTSKLDGCEERIRELLSWDVPKKRIAKDVGCTPVTLNNWLKRKGKSAC